MKKLLVFIHKMKTPHPWNLTLVSFSRKFCWLEALLEPLCCLKISSIFQDRAWSDFIAARITVVQLRWNFVNRIFSQLATIMDVSTKIRRVVSCDQLMSIIHFSAKLVKIAYIWRSIVAKLNRFLVCHSTRNVMFFHFSKSKIFCRMHGFWVIS